SADVLVCDRGRRLPGSGKSRAAPGENEDPQSARVHHQTDDGSGEVNSVSFKIHLLIATILDAIASRIVAGTGLSHASMRTLKHCCALAGVFLALAATPAQAQSDEALPALVQVLGASDDSQFHLDILKGMSDGLKGRRGVKMPAGWEAAAATLAKS